MEIRLIVFDLWETLIYRDVGYSTTTRMLEKTGAKICKEEFVKIYENTLQTKKWDSKFEAYKALCEKMGLETTNENINLLIKIRDEAKAKTKIFSHTISMLKQLKTQGYKIGLISNSSIFAQAKIKETGILEFIDYPLFSFDVGVVKPNLKIFKEILKLSRCKPKEVLMIGDKYEDDIAPAKFLGQKTILFENYEQLKKDMAYYRIFFK